MGPRGEQCANITMVKAPGAMWDALEWAARKGNFEIAEWLATDERTKALVASGAPVAWACSTNRVLLAKMLVANGANSHATREHVFGNKPVLHMATENGQLLAAQWLVDTESHDPHQLDNRGMSLRSAMRTNVKNWQELEGHVAVDRWAKRLGVGLAGYQEP